MLSKSASRRLAAAALVLLAGGTRRATAGTVQTLDAQVSTTVVRPDGYHATQDFGAVIVGAGTLTTNRFSLVDSGGSPASNLFFSALAAGDATVNPGGARIALASGSTKNLAVGIDTGTVGLRTGTVTIDSTPPGNDANEVYAVKATVLDHSNASFGSLSDSNVLNYDFGTLTQGGSAQARFGITNLVTTAGFTAALDLDSFSGTGDTGRLTTDLSSFSNLAAGSTNQFNAFFDLSTQGHFSATYVLQLSDQDLLGATGQTLTLNLSGTVVPVPEPSAAISGGIAGLLGLGGYGWRRRKAKATA